MLDELLKLDNQLCFRLYNVSRKMTQAYQPLLDEFNLTYPQYIILLVLFERKQIDFKELSKQVNLKTGTLTPILQLLEKNGYIVRIRNKKDRRKITVSLTESGYALKEKVSTVPVALQGKLQITISMYETLVKELDELSEILDKKNNIEVKE